MRYTRATGAGVPTATGPLADIDILDAAMRRVAGSEYGLAFEPI